MQFIFWGVVKKYSKLVDKSFNIVLETTELKPEQLLALDELYQQAVYVIIGENPIKFDEINIDELKEVISKNPKEWKKSQSERLRDVLYVYRQQFEKKHNGNFQDYYETTMEKYIKFYQDKLT